MDRADRLRKPLRFGSQWLQWSPRVFSESAPTLTTCPITFRGRSIPAGYSERDFWGIAKIRFARDSPGTGSSTVCRLHDQATLEQQRPLG
jgi:hypothetical protein